MVEKIKIFNIDQIINKMVLYKENLNNTTICTMNNEIINNKSKYYILKDDIICNDTNLINIIDNYTKNEIINNKTLINLLLLNIQNLNERVYNLEQIKNNKKT